ncbi:hypothetical protein PYW07_005514 [Mythimna separata]|uniref:CHK kinase-like domain-containing protein n=1 Tax=Mythimna separata TaxID=271217 RepID=A0AAD8DR09_MYTSE|nr:hypothetical protein PYW07_005514 [Mythimna separata]
MTQKESLHQLISKIATKQNYENPEIIINETSSGGANYTSKLYTVVVKGENKDDLHLYAKIAAFGEEFRKEMPVDIYGVEQFAYAHLLKKYASLEEEHNVPQEHRLYFSKCYGVDACKNQEILVLENLVAQGYGPHDRFNTYDWNYASAAVSDLAKMHALSMAFHKQYPEEFEKTMGVFKIDWQKMEESENIDQMVEKMKNIALKNVNPEYKGKLEKVTEDMKHPFTMYAAVRGTAIVHGDYRGSNLLHRVREDGKVEIKILDLQTMQKGSPVADLVYFIITGSDEKFRAQYYEKLIDHYYTELNAAMKRLNLDPEETYSREDFEYELKEKLPYGLSLAVFILPVVTVDTENAPDVSEITEVEQFVVEKTSSLYTERINGIVNDYVKWGIL